MKSAYFSFLLVLCFASYGQFNPANPTVPSANLAASKENVQVNTDLYNGKVNVTVPVLDYGFENLSLPVLLSYSGGNGIKADELPSWVGLGWNLQAGGYVHRTVRGKPDETLDFQTVERQYNFSSGATVRTRTTTLNTTDFSYYTNLNKLTASNWSTQAFSNTLKPSQSNYPYTLPYNDGSGAIINDTYYNHHPMYDLAPDEFTFVVGNISGKFYLNYLNKWVVESNDNRSYTVTPYLGEVMLLNTYKIPRVFKYLTLTSNDGLRFTFGNSGTSNDLANQYFDYSHSSATLPANGDISPATGATLIDIVPHTWHLTKVENLKTGSVTTLNYKFAGWQFYKTRQCWGNNGGTIYSNSQVFFSDPDNWTSMYRLSATSKVATRAWTLTDINYPNGTTVHFESNPSTQLSTNESIMASDNAGFYTYEDLFSLSYSADNTLLELDKIQISCNGVLKKELDLGYTGSSTQRLKLNTITEKDIAGNPGGVHQFFYSSVELPAYGAGRSDHWGYYNNKDFFASVAAPYNYTNLSGYSPYRDQDDAFLQAGMLTKIIYPTGGSVEFTFGPNTYSQKRSNTDFSLTNLGSTTEGGGVRIQKIIYKASDASTIEKDYDYSIPGAGGLTSGILSAPPADYLLPPSTSYIFRAAGFSPVYYSGSPVTYTYVTEKTPGNGSVLYQYSNYDNGFNDGLPIERNTGPVTGFDYAYNNNSRKRGKLLSMKTYKEGSATPVTEATYHYEHDNSESNKDEVRSLYFKEQGTLSYYYTSVSERSYNDVLIRKDEKMNSDQGSITETSTTSYDAYGNIKQVITYDSKGQVIRQKFKYAQEYSLTATDAVSQGVEYLNTLGIRDALVEKIVYRENTDGSNSTIMGASLYTYKPGAPYFDKVYNLQIAGPLPVASFTESSVSSGALVSDSRYSVVAMQYDSYDNKGNVLQLTAENGVPRSFVWGYGQCLRIADITNAAVQDAVQIIPTTYPMVNNQVVDPAPTARAVGSFNVNYAQTLSLSGTVTRVSGKASNISSFRIVVTNMDQNTVVYNSSNYFPTQSISESVPITVPGNYSVGYVYTIGDPNEPPVVSLTLTGNFNNQRIRHNLFHTSFEDDVTNVDNTNFVTGAQCHVGTYTLGLPGINGNYILTYWTKPASGGTWTFNKEMITVTNIAMPDKVIGSSGNLLDEVRLYPQGSLMTTYTYDPVYGLKSECDVNNKVTYYQYDALGRLAVVRDQYRNIIKAICYNYSGQPESCTLTNVQ